MIRRAIRSDILQIADTYKELLSYEEKNGTISNWKSEIYPTIQVPESAVSAGTMYVLEEKDEIRASMILNKEQAVEYALVDWMYSAPADEVLVIHTLCIPPQKAGCGYGRQMVAYAKEYAGKTGC